MHGLLADHAAHGLLRAEDHDALAHEHLRVPAADRGEVEVPLVVDVRYLEPDLVDVTRQHQPRPALGVERRDRVAVDVGRRSEEHTSELQSQSNLVCRLLLEKKKKNSRKHLQSKASNEM